MSDQNEHGVEPQADSPARRDDYQDDSVADKLSRELNNWRQRRSHSHSRRDDHESSGSFQSDAARTIKVRGHETLVIRKPKGAASRPPVDNQEPDANR
jgi:hypothetical protein